MKYRSHANQLTEEELRNKFGYYRAEYFAKEPYYETLEYGTIDKVFKEYMDIEKGVWKKSLTLEFHPYQLQQIYLVRDIANMDLFSALYSVDRNLIKEDIEASFSLQCFEEYEIPEKFKLNREKQFTVYASYPIDPSIKITIKPMTIKYPELKRESHIYTIGYIVWQVVKVYVDIYMYRTEDFHFGHAFTDLALGSLQLFEGNKGYIDFQS